MSSVAKRQVNRHYAILAVLQKVLDVIPSGYNLQWNGADMYFYGDDAKTQLAKAIRAFREVTNGSVKKNYADTTFTATITHVIPLWDYETQCNNDSEISFYLRAQRESVCRKIELGTELVEEIDYDKAPKVMVSKPIIQWECDPIMDGA